MLGHLVKPAGRPNMTAMEVAEALQLYMDGALLRSIAAEYGRGLNTIHRLAVAAGVKRGHAYRTKGPRDYLVARLMPVVRVSERCDCQLPETTAEGFAAVSIGCPIHGDADSRTIASVL